MYLQTSQRLELSTRVNARSMRLAKEILGCHSTCLKPFIILDRPSKLIVKPKNDLGNCHNTLNNIVTFVKPSTFLEDVKNIKYFIRFESVWDNSLKSKYWDRICNRWTIKSSKMTSQTFSFSNLLIYLLYPLHHVTWYT